MSEIEVGEYVRTKKGNIGKVLDITTCTGQKRKKYLIKWNINKAYYITSATITTHSKNIIDLIEEDDIVILEYYISAFRKRIQRKFEVETLKNDICFLNHRCSFLYDREKQKFVDGEGFNIKIKSILTHEQYEQNSYKVVE